MTELRTALVCILEKAATVLVKDHPSTHSNPTMSSTTSVETQFKSNVGVYTNPKHELWVAESGPSLDDVKSGKDLGEGDVYVGVKRQGCGSDVHFWHAGCIGPMVVEGNHILGHESAGVVLAVHPSVTSLKPGDRVAIEPNIPCHACEPCLPADITVARTSLSQHTTGRRVVKEIHRAPSSVVS